MRDDHRGACLEPYNLGACVLVVACNLEPFHLEAYILGEACDHGVACNLEVAFHLGACNLEEAFHLVACNRVGAYLVVDIDLGVGIDLVDIDREEILVGDIDLEVGNLDRLGIITSLNDLFY